MTTFVEQHQRLSNAAVDGRLKASRLSELPVYAGQTVERSEYVELARVSGLVACYATLLDPMYTPRDWSRGDCEQPDMFLVQELMTSRHPLSFGIVRSMRAWNKADAERLDATQGRLDFPTIGVTGYPREVDEETAQALAEIGETFEQFAFLPGGTATAEQLASHVDWLIGS